MAFEIRYILWNVTFNNATMKLKMSHWIFFLCVFSDISFYGVLGNLGGHALFASLSQLKDLWHNEVIIAQVLERMAEKCENPPTSITM